MEMFRKRACRKCGAEVLGGDLEGLCPACVAQVAFVGEPDMEAVPLRDLTTARLRYFGDYELLHEIARGGMGVVYKARQISLNRTVAVKMILAGQLASPADIQRFLAEAEAAANLQHPNIVAIHEVGQHDGQHFFSMDYVEGRNLSDLVAELASPLPSDGRGARGVGHSTSPDTRHSLAVPERSAGGTLVTLPWCRRAAAYVKTTAEAIEYAHQQGTLHRDLKPSNILVDRLNRPRITDFGLAKRVKRDSDLTVSGQIIGSPNFMPPEQAAGRRGEVGPQSDIYSLGALLYFLLTGQPPFEADTVHDTLTKVMHADPLPPRTFNAAVPRDLETVCLKCLEKHPARRYTSAQALAYDLARFLDGQPVLARPIGRTEKLWRTARRHQLVTALGGALLLLIVTLVILIGRHNAALGPLAGQNQSELPLIAEMPERSAQGISAMINGKFYVTSATAGIAHDYPKFLFVYDPKSNHWQRLADSKLSHSCPVGGAIGGKLYVAGGYETTNGITAALEVYDPVSNNWCFKKPMPTPRHVCASVVLNDKLFAIGGVAGTKRVAAVEVYDPATDTWTTEPNLRFPRVACAAAVIKDTIFVAGGSTNDVGICADDVEYWKPGQTNWNVLEMQSNAKMLDPGEQAFAAELGGVLYVLGGATDIGGLDRARCLVRSDAGWMWMKQKEMPAIRYMGCGAQTYGDEIWIFGGWTMRPDREAIPHADVFVFKPKGNSWRTSVPAK